MSSSSHIEATQEPGSLIQLQRRPASATSARDLLAGEHVPIALSVVVAVGALIRFTAARNLPPHVDESATILAAQQIGIHGYPILPSGIVYLQGALYSYLISPLGLFGVSPVDHPVWFRLPSVVAGTLALLAMYRLAFVLLGRNDGALFATLLLATDPLSIRWSGLARMYGLLQALTLTLLVFYFGVIFGQRSRRTSILLVSTFAAATFTHIGVCVLLPPMAIGALIVHRADLLGRRRDIVATLVACGLSPVLLLGLNRLRPTPGESPDGSSVRHLFVGDYFLSLRQIIHPNFDAWLSTFRPRSLPELFPALLIAGTGVLVVRFISERHKTGDTGQRGASFAVLALLYWIPVIAIAATVSDAENRYYIHIHPLAFVLLAMVVVELAQRSTALSTAPQRERLADTSNGRRRWPVGLLAPGKSLSIPTLARSRVLDIPGTWIAAATLVVPCAIALVVRLPLIVHLSLWLDEGFTILYSRLPWKTVLGFDGFYSPHPPLYFALVKTVSTVLPESTAGRAVSLLASLATIPVVWMIANQLLGKRAAFLSSMALALSPLHTYYAQEARMYALVVFLIALSYLALVSMADEVTWRWSAVYGCAAVLALYVDYSAAFALAPQLLVVGYLIDRHRKRAVALTVACGAAGLAYLPWLPNLADSVRAANDVERREAYLGSDPVRIPETLLSIVGIGGNGSYVQSTRALLWDAVPALRPVWLVLICVVGALGFRAVRRQSFAALVIASAFGTVAVAIWVSQISPAFAERTVLSATLGWVLLVGACGSTPAIGQMGKLANVVVVGALITSLYGTLIVDATATKQRWSDAVHELSSTRGYGIPIVTYSYGNVADTFLDVYGFADHDAQVISVRDGDLEAVLSDGNLPDPGMTLAEATSGGLATALSDQGSLPPYVWLLYYVRPGSDDVLNTVRGLGYERVRFGEYWTPKYRVYLDLFALSDARSGTPIDVNGSFDRNGEGWALPPVGSRFVSDQDSVYLSLSGDGDAPSAAAISREAGAGLYDLSFDMRSILGPESAYLTLECIDAHGDVSTKSTLSPDDLSGNGAEGWNNVRLAVACPTGTKSINVDLGVSATGEVRFRDVRLVEVARLNSR